MGDKDLKGTSAYPASFGAFFGTVYARWLQEHVTTSDEVQAVIGSNLADGWRGRDVCNVCVHVCALDSIA